MTQATDFASLSMTLGEVRGQLREVIHTMNNTAQKIDALTREVVEAKGLPADLAALEVRLGMAEARLALLEAAENKRVGAMGLGNWLLKHWPAILGLIALAVLVLELRK